MQSEVFDKKIKDAADHHHPNYDEQAWNRMEKLLDRHLPQNENRRRGAFFFLLLFVLLGGGGWLLIDKPWQKETLASQTENTVPYPLKLNPDPVPATPVSEAKKENDDPELNKPDSPGLPANQDKSTASLIVKQTDQPASSIRNPVRTDKPIAETKDPLIAPLTSKEVSKINETVNPVIDVTDQKTGITSPVSSADPLKSNSTPPTKPDANLLLSPLAANPTVSNKSEVTLNKPDKKEKTRKKNEFFFTLSTGPDITAVESGKTGDVKMLVGAGVGYSFLDRFSVRTGFYSARKVYSASPDDYYPPPGFWTTYPYMEKIDADCRVYEIPLSLSYNFGKGKKQTWFASAGVSSYIMKQEDYDYYYKYVAGGATYKHSYSIKNENKHFLSTLTFSGGYQRNFGKIFSVSAEPYVKLPIAGVGFGKVKLNSAGVMFSLGIKPFQGNEKKNKPVSQ
jgi:hypothetical protein